MTESGHLDILKRGVEAWNAWRRENPTLVPDLSQETIDPDAFAHTGLASEDTGLVGLAGAYGAPRFLRYAQNQEYIEESRGERRQVRYWLIYPPWLVSSDCGRSLGLWALWSLLMAVLFGVRFWQLGPEHFALTHLEYSLTTMVYYSAVTFTTLGFGDVVPKTAEAARWVMAEVMTGYLMLGGLIAIFSNKPARRS